MSSVVSASISAINEPTNSESGSAAFPPEVSTFLHTILRGFFILTIVVFPLLFGGVHSWSFLPFELITLTLFILFFIRQKMFRQSFSVAVLSPYGLGLALFTFYLLYLPLQQLVLALNSAPHAVLGTVTEVSAVEDFLPTIRAVSVSAALFCLTFAYCSLSKRNSTRLRNALFLGAALVGLTALTHWFYDNGKLFWTFEPEHVFTSDRARWPFVNANHLADYLLLVIFPLLVTIEESVITLRSICESLRARKISDLLISQRLQAELLKAGFIALAILVVMLAFLGSQSRGGWLGFTMGILAFIFLRRFFGVMSADTNLNAKRQALRIGEEVAWRGERHDLRSKRKRRSGESSQSAASLAGVLSILGKFHRPLLILLACFSIVFFLNEHGRELVQGRIEYGLMYSKDDIRWSMYKQSLPIFYEHPLLGVGVGNWERIFPQYLTPELAGIDPGYLHCDPLQLLIELGLAGVLGLAMVTVIFVTKLCRVLAVPASDAESNILKLRITGLSSALLALGVASLLDFPYRIPSIFYLAAILFGLTAFYLEKLSLVQSYRNNI